MVVAKEADDDIDVVTIVAADADTVVVTETELDSETKADRVSEAVLVEIGRESGRERRRIRLF